MTTPTPEQMRALADQPHRYLSGAGRIDWMEDAATALRAAADQLEAVQAQRNQWAGQIAQVERVADMAQDDEDGDGWVSIEPLLDALYPEKAGRAE